MVTIHYNGKKYKVQLRNRYSNIRSEKKLMELLNNTIEQYKDKNPKMYESLKKKNIFELFSFFGIATNKWLIE